MYLLPAFSLSIIIDSRVKIIGNERPGASPCDPRERLHANKSIVLYNIRLHISCSYFTFSLGFFHFLFHAEAANRKQTVNIATRGTTGIRIVTVCVFVRHLFSWYPFYFDFHSTRIIFDVSSGFYLWNINNTKADICKK